METNNNFKLEYKNYIIESERNHFVLQVYWDVKNPKTGEVKYWIIDEIYPSTLELALTRIYEREKSKVGKVTINEAIDKIKEVEQTFIKDLKDLISNIK